jgi:hypothetical protein
MSNAAVWLKSPKAKFEIGPADSYKPAKDEIVIEVRPSKAKSLLTRIEADDPSLPTEQSDRCKPSRLVINY